MRLPSPVLALWLGFTACAGPVPDACLAMCRAAVPLQQACLEEDGLGWDATVWGDREGFRESCETWAWTAVRLEADARRRGGDATRGSTDAACRERLRAFSDQDASCATYEAVDWDAPPGGAPGEDG